MCQPLTLSPLPLLTCTIQVLFSGPGTQGQFYTLHREDDALTNVPDYR